MANFPCAIGPFTKMPKGIVLCDVCGARCASWAALVRHFSVIHGFDHSDMRGHYIYDQAAEEKAKREVMTDDEFACVEPVVDPTRFHCKACGAEWSQGGQQFN